AMLGDRGSEVYNGVSLAEFDSSVPEIRDRPYLLAIGRHVEQKGFDVLIDAFARSNGPLTHDLVIAGDGPARPDLESLAAQLGCQHAVHFAGRTSRDRTASLFRGCDVFVLPSRHEPMGIVNLEAMASHRPVIATRVGGVPELVIDGVTGVLVPPADADALRVAIDLMLADTERGVALGAAGRARARSFDWPAIAAEYETVYQRATQRHHDRRRLSTWRRWLRRRGH
ncbi:MAG: glycosyltransferase, partial [Acidimicrobiia bacterium]